MASYYKTTGATPSSYFKTTGSAPAGVSHFKSSRGLFLDLAAALQEPSIQTVYPSIAALTTQCGRTFTEWYSCNIASGNLTGVAGTVLTNGGGTFRYQQMWPGWNGTDMATGYQALEFNGTAGATEGLAAATNAVYDLSQSLTFVFNARVLREPAAARTVCGKRAAFTAGSPGYTFYLSSTGGLVAVTCNGTTQSGNAVGPSGITGTDALANGAPQWFAVKFDITANFTTVYAYGGTGTPVAIPTGGAKTNASTFGFGGSIFNSCECMQVLQWGVLVGAEAEAFTATDLAELDNWCKVPSILTGYVRECLTSPVVANAATGLVVQHLSGSINNALTHFAHGWSANATKSTQGLGWEVQRGTANSSDTAASNLKKRNRLLHSDDISKAAWTKTNATATKNAGNDPSGFRGAGSLAATADNGFCSQDYTSELNEQHTHSIFVKRNGGADVTGRLVAIRTDTSAEIASVAFTATSGWTRPFIKFTAPTTTTRILVEIDTSGLAIFLTYLQAEYGTLTSYQTQRAALVDRDDTEGYIDNTGYTRYHPQGGRIEVTVCGYAAQVPSSGAFIFSTYSGAAFEDRHFIQRDALGSSTVHEARLYDSAGDVVADLELEDVNNLDEITYIVEWNRLEPLWGTDTWYRAYTDGVLATTGATIPTATWESGASATRLALGMRIAGDTVNYLAHLDGIVEDCKIYGP